MKKLVGCLLVMGLCLGLVGCGDNSKANVNTEDKQKIEAGLEKLKNLEQNYIITTTMQAPDGDVSYIEVQTTDGDSYTEYPIDGDGNLGILSEDVTADTQYVLSDWLSSDGSFHLVSEKDGDSVFYTLPKTYASRCKSRKYMYLDVMLDRFTEIKFDKTIQANIGAGEESLDLYKCKLPAETVKTIIGIGNYGLYESIKTDYADNENLVKLCDYYLNDLNMNLTFSDAIVTVGLSNGVVRYLGLEVGGLGTRLYMTKTIITPDFELRAKPDFSTAVDYTTTIQDLADYVASFDSYEDALNEINKGNYATPNSAVEEVPNSESIIIDDTSEATTEAGVGSDTDSNSEEDTK